MPIKKINLGLREKYFDLLNKGKKTADGRLFKYKKGDFYKNKYQNLNVGDILVYHKDLPNGTRTKDTIKVKVTKINFYEDIQNMLKDLKLKKVLPGVKSYKEGKELYKDIYGKKLKDGILIGFEFEKSKNKNTILKINKDKKNKKILEPIKHNLLNKPKEGVNITDKRNSPQTFELFVREPWITLIKSGLKEVEGRLYIGPVTEYRVGDKLILTNKVRNMIQTVPVKITKLTKYPNFGSLLFNEKRWRVLPGFPNIKTGIELYNSIYSRKDVEKFGALAITVQPLLETNKNIQKVKESLNNNVEIPEMDVGTQVVINANQENVHKQQELLNRTINAVNNSGNTAQIAETEEMLNSNAEMIENNKALLQNVSQNNVNAAVVASNQLAVNANQNNINQNQSEITKKKKNNSKNPLIINNS